MNPARAALLLDVLETAIDNRIERIEFALDPLWPVAPPSPGPSIALISASRSTIAARPIATRPIATRPIATAILVPWPIVALTVTARLARPTTGATAAIAVGARTLWCAGLGSSRWPCSIGSAVAPPPRRPIWIAGRGRRGVAASSPAPPNCGGRRRRRRRRNG